LEVKNKKESISKKAGEIHDNGTKRCRKKRTSIIAGNETITDGEIILEEEEFS
jgi:hypothetical protein